jgi:RNA-binding protein
MLNSKQIKYLKGLANPLQAKYQLGKNLISENNIDLLDKALKKNELIKVSLMKGFDQDINEAAQELALNLNAEVVQVIGKVIVLFRKNLNNAESKIHLPQ